VATLHIGNVTWGHAAINLGESVTKYDTQLAAFHPTLALAEDFLKEHQPQGPVYLVNSAKSTIPKFADTRPGPNQPTQLILTQYLNSILQTHTEILLRISWFKHDNAWEAYKNTKKVALDVVKKPINPDRDPITINYQ
jgi:hypothetical protein